MKKHVLFAALALFLFCTALAARAQEKVDLSQSQMPSVITVPPEALPSSHFDIDAATNAYLAQIPASAHARSDAYFEGGYWLILWDFLMAALIYWALLRFGWSAKMRDFAARVSRRAFLQDLLYCAQFLLILALLGAPLGIYEDYFREHKYGLATQTFGPWLGDQAKALLVNMILGGILVAVLFWIVRKLPRTWHVWGAIVTTLFMIFAVMIAPGFIFPLFNKITHLDDPRITQPVLSLARANGIPAHDVFKIDASRQSTRMSANVSGFGKTMRITMNDNLIRRGSIEEIQSIMGHEMGHYVLHHIYKTMLFIFIVIVAFFSLLRWGLDWSLARWGERWRICGIEDAAVLPLVFLIASIFFFVLTPITSTETRTAEHEADMYGINASRQPDGFAQAAIHLGEYRKMSPGPIEEFVFFDHPSGRRRIHDAMQWKAENLQLFQNQSTH
jgi:STE24 endopeptidase